MIITAATTLAGSDREIRAVRSSGHITIDGQLDEAAWQRGGCTDFVQNDPVSGAEPTEKSEVWIAFDEKYLFIAAKLYDSEPGKIISRLGRLDDPVESDWFTVALDPYYDKLSGFEFSVNPAGSRIDNQLFNDSGKSDSWNGIWQAAARITQEGWQLEMRIPFNELRFKQASKYTWGIDCRRLVRRKQERTGLAFLPKNESGYVSRFIKLTGISEIRVSRSHYLVPYFSSRAELLSDEKDSLSLNGGLDLKIPLQSNLILDLTVNPDFGQVEVDPAEINLSGFETFLEEKRPFFIEGSAIFNFGRGGVSSTYSVNWPGPEIFYSRRIGRAPRIYPENYDELRSFPEATNIYAAAKISGKLFSNLNLGFLSAFTSRQQSRYLLEGRLQEATAEPAGNYNVLRVQREFNAGSAALGMIFTGSHNYGNESPVEDALPQNSMTLGLDGFLKIGKEKKWAMAGWVAFSDVSGSAASIAGLQLDRPHYYQKPDYNHIGFDPSRTALRGWSGRIVFNREKGNLIFNANLGAISPGFDVNTIGYLSRSDLINGTFTIGYQRDSASSFFKHWEVASSLFFLRNFNWETLDNGAVISFYTETRDFWHIELMGFFSTANLDNYITRGGISLWQEAGHMIRCELSTDNRRKMIYGLEISQDRNYNGTRQYEFDLYWRYKIRSNLDLTISPEYSFGRNTRIWVDNFSDPLATATYGTRHLFATIDQKTLAANIRLNWIFNPHTSFQLYLQPLIGSGNYSGFKELLQAKSSNFLIYGEQGSTIARNNGEYLIDPDGSGPALPIRLANPDFNFKSLRGTALLRWEFRPGSTLYLVWTQDRSSLANPGSFSLWRDLTDMLRAPGDNILMLKFTYLIQI